MFLLTVETGDGFVIFTGVCNVTASLKTMVSNVITSSSGKVLDSAVMTASVQLNYAATAISVIVPADITIKPGF